MLEKEEKEWASIEDFATLFQYFWHRDFPMDARIAVGAGRVDWTIHIGVVVRNIADLMGLVTRFERGGRKDAILRSTDGDEVAIEWEWSDILRWIDVRGNEVEKLKKHAVKPKGKERLKYAVLITYTHNIKEAYKRVTEKWEGARWPLLLILIDVIDVPKRKIFSGREFQNIQMSVFSGGEEVKGRELRSAKAFPWEVAGTSWSYRLKE
ncbi:MAG: hypothetical protein HY663_02660 [Chloroflexi bacterium]|nr:hypothetical protein [Chloroflexota bacterium]